MRFIAIVCAIASASLIATAAPARQDAAPADGATADKPKKEKKICRRELADLGSRFAKGKVCKTQAEWEALNQRAPADGGPRIRSR